MEPLSNTDAKGRKRDMYEHFLVSLHSDYIIKNTFIPHIYRIVLDATTSIVNMLILVLMTTSITDISS